MLEFQLNEEKVNNPTKDLHARVRELRHLNNSADDICKKISTEFGKDYDDVKRYLLPADLKRYVDMTSEELNKVGKEAMRKLKSHYSKIAPASNSGSAFIKGLIDAYITKGV